MRLIDLHVDWLLQYAQESTVFNPDFYPGVVGRCAQLGGYLQSCRAAIVACYRRADDWATRSDPWAALGELTTRLEAEFPGRLLIAREDFDRWQTDREGLTWGLIGVEGFDSLIRTPRDLDRLPALFERGIRLFQPIYDSSSQLGGSATPGDDRGLGDLGRDFLAAVDSFASVEQGARPLVDLAHMNPSTMSDVLGWYEAEPSRVRRVILLYSHGCPVHAEFESPRAITFENLRRLRALGGSIGLGVSPPFFSMPRQIKEAVELIASFPFEGQEGLQGIAIGTDFMGVDRTLTGLGNAEEVVGWVQANFDRGSAKDLLHDNALGLIARATGSKH